MGLISGLDKGSRMDGSAYSDDGEKPEYKPRVQRKPRPCFSKCGPRSPERRRSEDDATVETQANTESASGLPPPHEEDSSWYNRLWARASTKSTVSSEVALLSYGLKRPYELRRIAVQVRLYCNSNTHGSVKHFLNYRCTWRVGCEVSLATYMMITLSV